MLLTPESATKAQVSPLCLRGLVPERFSTLIEANSTSGNQDHVESFCPNSSVQSLTVHAVLILFLLLASAMNASADSIEDQRDAFIAAEQKAKSGQLAADDPLLAKLHNYPLYRYLEYHRIASRRDQISIADVERFRAQFPESHLEGMLRFQLTRALATREEWSDFIRYYEGLKKPNRVLRCHYATAQLRAGDSAAGEALASELWQAGRSQPDACDYSFNQLRAQDKISSSMGLNRLLNALDARKWALAGYAERFISEARDQAVATKAKAIYQNPEQIVALSKTANEYENYLDRFQQIAINRTYRQSSSKAFALLNELGDDLLRTPAIVKLIERVGIRVSKDLDPAVEKQLSEIDPDGAISELTEWRIRLALEAENFDKASELIAQLPQEMREEDRWVYWRSRVDAALSSDLPDFGDLSGQRSFYGFLAAELTGDSFSMNQQSPRFTDELYKTLLDSGPMIRIQELIALDRYTVARSEWNQWKETLDLQQRQAVAHLMRDLDWYQQGILTAAYEGLWNDLQLRFPTVYMDIFSEQAKAKAIDPIWALAVSRQESALFPWARSPVGARGLMQLMPKTASQTARLEGINYRGKASLFEPSVNIRLGTAYLAQMYEKFEGNRVYASAAYNAGPHRVTRWLAGREDLPLDIWIETIPFDETRNYVQNVLSFALIYAQLNDEPMQMLNENERNQMKVASR